MMDTKITISNKPKIIKPIEIKDSIIENFWKYVEKQTSTRSLFRFLFEKLIISVFSQMPTIIGYILRGMVYRLILGGIGCNCMIGKNVRFNTPKNIFLGKRVKIGEGSIIEARAAGGKVIIGDDSQISRYSTIASGEGNVEIGKKVLIGQFAWLEGYGGLEIGDYTLTGPHITIVTSAYTFDNPSIHIEEHPFKVGKVTVGEDCWLGTHVVVLPGVSIGKGTVVGAGAVVPKSLPEYCVSTGVPAKVTRKREEPNN